MILGHTTSPEVGLKTNDFVTLTYPSRNKLLGQSFCGLVGAYISHLVPCRVTSHRTLEHRGQGSMQAGTSFTPPCSMHCVDVVLTKGPSYQFA